MNLVIVESPAKARTINKYLGNDYKVLASYGHVRDLPSKNGSVDPDNNFKMLWEIDSFSKKYLKEITDTAADSEKIIFATDPDREGEAIAWHIKEVLEQKKLLKSKTIERVVFYEITKKAVTHGIENPKDIEPYLVDAYMARRALDYLVGFNISYTNPYGDMEVTLYGENVLNEVYDVGRLQQSGFVGVMRSNDRSEFGLKFKKDFEL